MSVGHRIAGAATAGALILSALAPTVVQARHGSHYGGGYSSGHYGGYGHHRRHRDRFDVGDAVGIFALLGAVAIIASSADKARKAEQRPRTTRSDDDRDDREYRSERDDRDVAPVERGDRPDDYAAADAEDAAVNECALAARDRASSDGRFAEVRGIETVRSVSDGFDVTGRVEERNDVRAVSGTLKRFSCTWRNGRVASLTIGGEAIAMR